MATATDICNYALTYIGERNINSLSENIKPAIVCSKLYHTARKASLRDHIWSFATKQIKLALTTIKITGWDYVYQYPNDCLNATKIYSGTSEHIEYKVRIDETNTRTLIVSNEEDAELIYVADVDNENLFDSLYVEALSYRIASLIAVPLKGDTQLQQLMQQNYMGMINKAQATDSNESYEEPVITNEIYDSRF